MDSSTLFSSIITSLIASIVFWFAFSFVPSIIRWFRIRPRVENDLSDIRMHLFLFIQIPFLQSIHSSSLFQEDIKEKRLNLEDFEDALYGKCISEARRNGFFQNRLLNVSGVLIEQSRKIDKRLDLIYRYVDYLRTSEILVLKEIGEKIHTYEFVEHDPTVDNLTITPVNPSISYMKKNFYDLYELYHRLNRICESHRLIKCNGFETYLSISRKMNRGILFCPFARRKLGVKYSILLKLRKCIKNNKVKSAETKLREYLECEKEKLVYQRGILEFVLCEEHYRNLLVEIRGEDEFLELQRCVKSEVDAKNRFRLRNTENRMIIERMKRETTPVTAFDEDTIRKINKLFDGYL